MYEIEVVGKKPKWVRKVNFFKTGGQRKPAGPTEEVGQVTRTVWFLVWVCSHVRTRKESRLVPCPGLGLEFSLVSEDGGLGEKANWLPIQSWSPGATGGFCVEGVSWSIKNQLCGGQM